MDTYGFVFRANFFEREETCYQVEVAMIWVLRTEGTKGSYGSIYPSFLSRERWCVKSNETYDDNPSSTN